ECLPRDVPRRRPPAVCRSQSLRRAEVCAFIPGPAPPRHAPPRTVLPPLCLMGDWGSCHAYRRIPPGIFGAVSNVVHTPQPATRASDRAEASAFPTAGAEPLVVGHHRFVVRQMIVVAIRIAYAPHCGNSASPPAAQRD